MDDWDLDMHIESAYDDNSIAEMEAYEAMIAGIEEPEPVPMNIENAANSTSAQAVITKEESNVVPAAVPQISEQTKVLEHTELTTACDVNSDTTSQNGVTQRGKSSPIKRKRPSDNINYVLRNPPLDSSFVAFTTTSGERLYLRCSKEEGDSAVLSGSSSMKEFLNTSEEEEQKISENMAAMIERIKRRQARRNANDAVDHVPTSSTSSASSTSKKVKALDLWVDKYAPRHFSDLLSPERTNREVLRWMKSWDPAVFGTQAPPESKKSTYGARYGNSYATPENKKDPNDRSPPKNRVILICGPPGLGKTTLAHIVAKHAGYNPFEINASDDRSTSILTQKIKDAMEMQTMFGENKPNCIILDEIDGSTGGGESRSAVAALVRMVKNSDGSSQKGSNKSIGKITRPVICICNNLYAPALRPLRSVAQIFMMNETKSERLMSRIKTICRHERVVLRPDALSILCSRTDNDIRSCLNTLQFLSTRCSVISRDQIMKTCVGHKDRKVALFEAWKSIFYTKASGAKRSNQVFTATSNHHRARGKSSRLVPLSSTINVMTMVSQLGRDVDRVFDGIHENFITQHYNDPMFLKTTKALDWLCFGDMCSHLVMARQQWKLMKYISTSCAGVHHLCRSTVQPSIQYPRQSFACRQKKTTNRGMLETFASGMFKYSGGITKEIIVKDVLSPWLDIVSPRVRPISKSLMSNWEKRQVDHLVELLSSQSITFAPAVPTFGRGGGHWTGGNKKYQSQLVMDPPVHTLVQYTDQPYESSHHVLNTDVIRIVSHEIELTNMRKCDQSSRSSSSTTTTATMSSSTSPSSLNNDNGVTKSVKKRSRNAIDTPPALGTVFEDDGVTPKTHGKVKDHSHLIEKAKVKKTKYVKRDFFGRKVVEPSQINTTKGKKRVRAVAPSDDSSKKTKGEGSATSGTKHERVDDEVLLSMTMFKFIPGFTNAVKRRANVGDFF
jgi:chromosome transmission fidelity protein 18